MNADGFVGQQHGFLDQLVRHVILNLAKVVGLDAECDLCAIDKDALASSWRSGSSRGLVISPGAALLDGR